MANPIFTRSSTFNGRPVQQQPGYQQMPNGYGQASYAQPGYQQAGYPQPGYVQPGQQGYPQQTGVMTFDDVIAKTAITLLLVFASAALTFMFMPAELMFPVMLVSSIAALIAVFIVAGRRQVPVAGVAGYAVLEGVVIGALSKMFESLYDGIVFQAVLATFVAAGATLAAYKFFNIRVTPRMRRFVMIGTMAIAGLFLVNLVFALFGVDLGMRDIGGGASWLSILISVIAVGLAVFNLIVDFDAVERGVAAQVPAQESWRAALGITVTMVWLYIELLRIASYFRD